MTTKQQFKRKPPKCHQCGRFGHICRYSPTEVDDKRKHRDSKQKVNAASVKDTECSSDS